MGGEVAVLGADRGQRGLFERVVQPLGAGAGLALAALAGGLVVARALASPARDVLRAGKHRHVDADLGEGAFRAATLDADGEQTSSTTGAKGWTSSSISSDSASICSSRKSMWFRIAPIHTAWWRSKRPPALLGAPGSSAATALWPARPAPRGRWSPHTALRASPTGGAENVAGNAVELDPGVLHRLVQPVGLTLALLDLGLVIPSQVAQPADRLGGTKLARNSPAPPAGTATPHPRGPSCAPERSSRAGR